MGKQWIALFSQTGTEIQRLSKLIGREPDVLLTDSATYNPDTGAIDLSPEEINDWLMTEGNVEKDAVITLHGYLNIIPEAVINFIEENCGVHIYNGHPALVTMYPELKGRDPQIRVHKGVLEGRYTVMGSVVHVVTPEVDGGKVVMSVSQGIATRHVSLEEVFRVQSELSIKVWKSFFDIAFLSERSSEDA